MATKTTGWFTNARVHKDTIEDDGSPVGRLAGLLATDRRITRQRKEADMAAKKQSRQETENVASKESETYRVAYMFESNVWGQAMFLEEPKNGMVLITASDFDSGQTVRIGLDIDTFSHLCKTGQTFAAMKSIQGDDGEKDGEDSL